MLENVINEAVRELNIKDTPNIYRLARRWAREHIKHEVVSPIDMISWPKGCLMLGLMFQAYNASTDSPIKLKCIDAVEEYINKWIKKGAPIYILDDCLCGVALLMLIQISPKDYSHQLLDASDKLMQFLRNHSADTEGSWPYRPSHKNGRIFADGIGMAAPYAICYGLINKDENAVNLGIIQIENYLKYGFDVETELPYHAYSLKEDGRTEHFGSIGWGRAVGWIALGLKLSLWAFEQIDRTLTDYEEKVKEILISSVDRLTNSVRNYMRIDGLFGSQLLDENSLIDTSASAMILYAMDGGVENISKYITEDGCVDMAQGECMDLGVYSNEYKSYPWSVGMTLVLGASSNV